MKTIHVITPYGTKYVINAKTGKFIQYNEHVFDKNDGHQWDCIGIGEILPFGNIRRLPFQNFISMAENGEKFTFKNGKPKYTLIDADHGTVRIHGNTKYHGISYAGIVNE